jgi:LPS-assembly lipoprotein
VVCTRKIILTVGLLTLSCLLSACGFHLRGDLPLAPPLKKLYLQTQDPYGQLARNIRQFLKFSGVELTSSAATAKTVLVIVREATSDQLLSIGGTQQTRQYNITLTVTFEVTDPQGKILLPPEVVSETRSLTILSNQILGGSNEENNLFVQMRGAIVYDIMSRLSSQDVTLLINPPPPVKPHIKPKSRHARSS